MVTKYTAKEIKSGNYYIEDDDIFIVPLSLIPELEALLSENCWELDKQIKELISKIKYKEN